MSAGIEPIPGGSVDAFARTASAPLVQGNAVRLLRDAAENYPAWLEAIRAAERYVYFESYIIHDDDVGAMFADALMAKAAEGVRVRVVYDWMGGFRKTSRRFWRRLRSGGVEVRCYNPPRLSSPLGWVQRDHRKMLSVDGRVGFVTGLCVGRAWAGDPEHGIDPWRDSGLEIRGPAVGEIERAFADVWSRTGLALPDGEALPPEEMRVAGDVPVRVVASAPGTVGLLRLDLFVAATVQERLWISDAYFAGIPSFVQALRAAATDGVDVRLLVPGASDIPLLSPLSQAGYRPLLDAGVRVFEWKGPMMHSKTAVADGQWARVGSTNLNVASWLGNLELDVVVEEAGFAQAMEREYLYDLENATELVLHALRRRSARVPGAERRHRPVRRTGGSAGRAAAGAIRIGHSVGAAMTAARVLAPVEARLLGSAGALLFLLAAVALIWPSVVAVPLAILGIWIGAALLARAHTLRQVRQAAQQNPPPPV